LKNLKKEAVNELQSILAQKDKTFLPRDDYKELVELGLILLDALPNRNQYVFKKPGACHRARWMVKVIYSMKTYIFRSQFELTVEEVVDLKDMCIFFVLIYIRFVKDKDLTVILEYFYLAFCRFWMQCPKAVDAPANDLQLYQYLHKYKSVNKRIAMSCIKKFENHLWYLGPELVPLALFSNIVTIPDKRKMQLAIKSFESTWTDRTVRLKETKNLQKKKLWELVNETSYCALQSLKLDMNYLLNTDPQTWNLSHEYASMKSRVQSLAVVNDPAERGIAFMSQFNKTLTKNEDEKQKIIQVVEINRKQIPNPKKNTLINFQSL
jgi:hypothetical protein